MVDAQAGPDPDRYIVKFRNRFGEGTLRGAGGDVRVELPWLEAVAARIPAAAVQGLRNNPNILYIEKDPPRYPLSQTVPYGIELVEADQVSDAGAAAITVCIIDSGYDVAHPDLPSSVSGTDDAGAGPWDEDGFGHGTHVAGTITALNNGLGVVGVLPNDLVGIHIVRVFGDSGAWAYSSTLVAATNQCKNAGADVISMSLGCNGVACSSSTENSQFRNALRNSAEDLGASGRDTSFGFGLVRAQEALELLGGAPGPTSTPTPTASSLTATPTPTASSSSIATPTRTATTAFTSTATPTRTATSASTSTPTPTPTPTSTVASTSTPTPSPTGSLALSAVGYKVKGQKADLSWTPNGAGTVNVIRNGATLYTTANDGFHTDPINNKGGGSYTYRVCVTGTTTCSNTVSVSF